MGLTNILRGFSFMLFALVALMAAPIIFAIANGEQTVGNFFFSAIITLFVAIMSYTATWSGKRTTSDFRGVLVLVLVWWMIVPCFAALPLALGKLSPADGYFEAVAALTTTGGWLSADSAIATRSEALWRAELQWIGGLASISIAAAIFIRPAFIGIDTLLPPFSRGDKNSFIRPLRNAVRAFFTVYLALTVFAGLALIAVDVPAFEAVIMALSFVASGGFAPVTGSLQSYDTTVFLVLSPIILISGLNFGLIARMGKPDRGAIRDNESIVFFYVVVILGLLYWGMVENTELAELARQMFNAASILSTNSVHIGEAPPLTFVLVTSIIGGAAVSAAGGFKLLRWMVILRRGREEIRRLIIPNAIFGSKNVLNEFGVWMHFLVFTFTLATLVIVLSIGGHGFDLAVTAATAALSNAGPLIFLAEPDLDGFNVFDQWLRWFLLLGMILGRLEAVVALALFNIAFWRS